jgi:hypothetical protein
MSILTWIAAQFAPYIEQRKPPVDGVKTVSGVGAISDIFDSGASRQAAGYSAWKHKIRRRPPADAWLRQGEA